ncbi:hypothetical protein AAE478_009001 [Parahypoxylon ruwenzoriense]
MSHNLPHPSRQDAAAPLRRRRLLSDIKELVEKPYPNITLHFYEEDLSTACLILEPANYKRLHLTMTGLSGYPVNPPAIRMDSNVRHPNVFEGFICATILNNEGYSPAYTLKGIAIQMLSFFSSDKVEQSYGGTKSLADYKALDQSVFDGFQCRRCHFNSSRPLPKQQPRKQQTSYNALVDSNPDIWPTFQGSKQPRKIQTIQPATPIIPHKRVTTCQMERLPSELLLLVLESLDFEELTSFAAAWSRISNVMREFDVVRQRELQCFCLKQNYLSLNLGIGVYINRGEITSEFDLLSQDAFKHWSIRLSVNHLPFRYWLPLPISHQHWRRVQNAAKSSLGDMKTELRNARSFNNAQVIFTFMNDVVVRLNEVSVASIDTRKSNLRHASEKAIESYFHLFHLLVCLATEDPSLVESANALLRNFIDGKRSKADCPNLGHLLIALLISDIEVTEGLMKAIITEAITRNVVWLFDRKGANMPELSYMETDPVSAYRLKKSFEGSRTSYRLLMFSELFRRTARPSHQKPLCQVRDELFDRHGAPPRNSAQELSATVRRLHTINDFPAFMKEMGISKIPSPETFTKVLRDTVRSSMEKGYSRWAISQGYALALRTTKESTSLPITPEMNTLMRQSSPRDESGIYGGFFPTSHRF